MHLVRAPQTRRMPLIRIMLLQSQDQDLEKSAGSNTRAFLLSLCRTYGQ